MKKEPVHDIGIALEDCRVWRFDSEKMSVVDLEGKWMTFHREDITCEDCLAKIKKEEEQLIMNEELMRHRGEYVTLEMELEKVRNEIAADIKQNASWASYMNQCRDRDTIDMFIAARAPDDDMEKSVAVLKRIQSNCLKAKDLKERLERLRPLAMMDSELS